MSATSSDGTATLSVEVRFFASDRQQELSAIDSGETVLQRVVVVNSDARPYDYRVWTSVGNGLRYTNLSPPTNRALFPGRVGFHRQLLEVRGVEHYVEASFEAAGQTTPSHVAVAKGLNVGNELEGGWKRIDFAPDYVQCNP